MPHTPLRRKASALSTLSLALLLSGCGTDITPPDVTELPETPVVWNESAVDGVSITVPVAGDLALSSVAWSRATNALGPVELNTSVGGSAARDGRVLTLNGTTYTTGLGVAAPSSITYTLAGQCAALDTDVGIDDEVGKRGSAVFRIAVDGAVVYDSGTLTGTSATRHATVDLTGKNELTLTVLAGNSTAGDHADWAGAVLRGCVATPVAAPDVALSALTPVAVTNGFGPLERDMSNGENAAGDGRTLTLNGTTYASGLGVHADSAVTYDLAGAYRSLTFDLGIDDEVGARGNATFEVWSDGTRLYTSGAVTGDSPTQRVALDVTGTKQLTLKVLGNGSTTADHADWAAPQLSARALDRAPTPSPSVSSVTVGAPTTLTVGTSARAVATVSASGAWDAVTWTSSNPAIATIDAAGTVSAVAPGTVTLTATSVADPSKTGRVTLETLARPAVSAISVSPTTLALTAGDAARVSAAVSTVGGGSVAVTWTSSDPAVATVDATGTVSAVAAGSATITATSVLDPARSASVSVSVSAPTPTVTGVSVTPTVATLIPGDATTLTGTVTTTHGGDASVTWTSSAGAIATVDAGGTVTAIAPGTATITATSVLDPSRRASATITVSAPTPTVSSVTVSPATLDVVIGTPQRVSATVVTTHGGDTGVTWSSSAPAVATVDADGTVTGAAPGTATITATSVLDPSRRAAVTVTVRAPAPVVSGVTVSPTSKVLYPGRSVDARATVTVSGGSDAVTWTSAAPGVATVTSAGTITAVAAGSATITATSVADPSKSARVAVTVYPTPQSRPAGTYTTLAAEGATFTVPSGTLVWFGTDQATLAPSGAWYSRAVSGTVTCSAGTFGGDPAYGVGKTCTVLAPPSVTSISVTPTTAALTTGGSVQASAAVTTVNGGSTAVTWTTSNPAIAGVDATGRITAVAAGSATVTATSVLDPSRSARVGVTVSAPVPAPVVYAAPLTISQGGTYSGNWASTSPTTPAITITTTAPVVIQNCNLRGPGKLISVPWIKANVTVRNCRATGTNPNDVTRTAGRFISAEGFESMVIENNTIEKTAGIYLNAWAGSTRAQPIVVRYNTAHNLEGRYSDGAGGWVDGKFYRIQFLQFNAIKNVPNVDIAWNRVDNEAYNSHVEDVINIYASSGTAASPIRIHHNLINGAFGSPPDAVYSGGGIMIGDGDGGYTEATDNTVIETSNYGIAVAGGNYQSIRNNTVLGRGKLDSGVLLDADTDAGIYIRDYHNNPAHLPSSVVASGNTVGWGNPSATNPDKRWDISIGAAGIDGGNTRVNGGVGAIDPTLLSSAITAWVGALRTAGLTVGAR